LLTLNVLLSFAQFEREVIGERVRDKIAASKRKGIWSSRSSPSLRPCRATSNSGWRASGQMVLIA
jgi:DNA invertase Pin-like site-specific DNA recombinase